MTDGSALPLGNPTAGPGSGMRLMHSGSGELAEFWEQNSFLTAL